MTHYKAESFVTPTELEAGDVVMIDDRMIRVIRIIDEVTILGHPLFRQQSLIITFSLDSPSDMVMRYRESEEWNNESSLK
jgi:hypothetical protein